MMKNFNAILKKNYKVISFPIYFQKKLKVENFNLKVFIKYLWNYYIHSVHFVKYVNFLKLIKKFSNTYVNNDKCAFFFFYNINE
jgi:hypothetical protein